MNDFEYKAWIKPTIENGEVIYTGGIVDVTSIDFRKEIIEYIEAIYQFGGMIGYRHKIKFDEADLLRSTPLTDKENNRIYEGHLLKFKSQSWLSQLNGDPKQEHILPILWNEEELRWGLKISDNDWVSNLTISTDDKQFEIVGWIFENPELITK